MTIPRQRQLFASWGKGLLTRGVPRLQFPQDGLAAGSNVILAEGGIRTRPGYSSISGGLPDGEVMWLGQVRFPTNEVSYLLAQVRTEVNVAADILTTNVPLTSYMSLIIWDIEDGVIVGHLPGQPTHEFWRYDPVSGIFEDMSTGNTGMNGLLEIGVYLPDTHEVFYLRKDGTNFEGNVLDLDLLEWAEPWTTASPGDTGTDRGHYSGFLRSGKIIFVNAQRLLEIDKTTYGIQFFTNETGLDLGDEGSVLLTYDSSADIMWTVQFKLTEIGTTCFLKKYDFGTDTWTTVGTYLDLGGGAACDGICYCSGNIYLWVGDPSISDSMIVLDCSTGAKTLVELPNELIAVAPFPMVFLVDDAGGFYVYAFAQYSASILYNPFGCNLDSHCGLYAAPDNLPATSLAWEQIYDLGDDAGVISVAVLGDRAIITDANNVNVPLVWSGGLADDGSDWAYPNHVLTFADGAAAYDISQYVLDKDADNSADIANIDASGFIDIVTDVPKIEALRFEMGSPNVGLDDSQSYSIRQTFESADDLERRDLKNEIVYWKRDDTNTNITAGDAVEKVDGNGDPTGYVGIPCTGHPFLDEAIIVVAGSTNYNGVHVVDPTSSTNEVVIEADYVAESFTGSETIRLNKSTGHFEGVTLTIDNAAAVDKGGGLVGIPLTGQPYSAGDQIEIRDTTNYDGTYSVDATSSTNEVVIAASYAVETFSGSETINQRVTLGSGNDCPNVEEGLELIISSVSKQIIDITGDGEADNEVQLSSAQDDAEVTAAYGINVIDDAVTINYEYDTALSGYVIPSDGRAFFRGYSLRIIVDGSDFPSDRDNPRFTFRHYHYTHILHASIGERSGSTANTTTTPTEITFNDGESGYFDETYWDVPSSLYPPYGDPPAINIQSDILTGYTIETAKQYIVTLDLGVEYRVLPRRVLGMDYLTIGSYPAGCYLSYSYTGHGYYHKQYSHISGYTWDQASVTGFTAVASGSIALVKVEGQYLFPVYTTQRVVGHTTNSNRLLVSFIEQINSVTVNQVKPGSSVLWHAISFDGRATFQVFKSGAWRSIVRLNSTTWEYNTSATATPSWSSAAVNTRLGALFDAFGVSYNQWSETEIEAMDSDDWGATGGFTLGGTIYLDWGFALQASGTDWPKLHYYSVSYLDTGSAVVEGFVGGEWTIGEGWTDGTSILGVPLAQDGSIVYDGSSPFSADYHTLDQIPGYHYRIRMYGTSPSTSLTRVLYKAPCQPLANIGLGQPDYPLMFLWHDSDSGEIIDYSDIVNDETFTELSSAAAPLDENKWIYVGCLTRFSAVEMIPYAANEVDATLTVQYWTGSLWTNLVISDGTKDSGEPFAQRGLIRWTVPTDWKEHVPLDVSFYRGYYIRITSNTGLTSTTAIAECRVYPVPEDLKKHKEAVTFRDRLTLISRPDYGDMVEISRQYEEYGFYGQDSGRYRVGGTDGIQCAVSAWNGLLLGKRESWHYLTGSSPADFSWQTIEAARHIAINSRVIVKAPMDLSDGLRNGIFFLNQYGVFALSGLQADTSFATGRAVELTQNVNWWDEGAEEHIDVGALAKTGWGAYWPKKNWVLWAVPMTTAGASEQALNNRLIVYDLALGAWLPPFDIGVSSLATAYHYDADVPGKLADVGLYAGNYSGEILRLFSGSDTTDDGTAITSSIKTGLIHFGTPGVDKDLCYLRLFGRVTGSGTWTLYIDSETTATDTGSFSSMVSPSGKLIEVDYSGMNLSCKYFELELTGSGVIEIEAVYFEYLDTWYYEGQGVT
jgi:hypothetical protein